MCACCIFLRPSLPFSLPFSLSLVPPPLSFCFSCSPSFLLALCRRAPLPLSQPLPAPARPPSLSSRRDSLSLSLSPHWQTPSRQPPSDPTLQLAPSFFIFPSLSLLDGFLTSQIQRKQNGQRGRRGGEKTDQPVGRGSDHRNQSEARGHRFESYGCRPGGRGTHGELNEAVKRFGRLR